MEQNSPEFYDLHSHLFAQTQSRITYQTANDFSGTPVETAQWELGGFNGHPDHNYSDDHDPVFPGYTVAGGPVARPPKPALNFGWDVSHARRLVGFFWTIEKVRMPLGLSFPIERIMKGLTNQVAYVTFNRNFSSPNFTNYLDGTNGWYRVNYSNRVNFGYPPSSWGLGGASILGGGYAFWIKYNPEFERVIRSAAQKYTFPTGASSWGKIEALLSYPLSYFE
ncbi:MAG: hypothetical protein KF789_03420 [Bdellovibrionaceae bacterium]|nr:hypothetical protein [Pseudobdellovibrionaceae bacterium]